jgi:ACR3 family arsenite transporter
LKVDFGSIRNVGRRPRGLFVTLFVNWLVKPFSMAVIALLFFRYVFSQWISPADADQYIAGRHHPRGGALHRDGVRLESSDRW